jgi:hypothetical protein
VFEKRALGTTSEGEATGDWREKHNKKLHDLYCSENVIRVSQSRRIRRVGHVARTGGKERYTKDFNNKS